MEAFLEKIFKLAPRERDEVLEKCNSLVDQFLKPVSTVAPKKVKKQQPGKEKYENVEKLETDGDNIIFQKLKSWRSEVSKDLEIQPYLVFDNKTLTNIAFYKPTTEQELIKIKGIGPEKAGKYGETIMEICKEKTLVRRLKSNE
jgi:superfamily II DNA helicase RecQ